MKGDNKLEKWNNKLEIRPIWQQQELFWERWDCNVSKSTTAKAKQECATMKGSCI